MRRRSILSLLAMVVVAASCASPVRPSANPSPAPSQAPGSDSATTLALRAAPPDLGCDAMPVDYRRVTFQIDPSAEEPVTALTDTGRSLKTFWSAGFRGSADGGAVHDPNGQVVAANGETLDVPEGALPRLHGYFVCPSTDAVYVLLQDPT